MPQLQLVNEYNYIEVAGKIPFQGRTDSTPQQNRRTERRAESVRDRELERETDSSTSYPFVTFPRIVSKNKQILSI